MSVTDDDKPKCRVTVRPLPKADDLRYRMGWLLSVPINLPPNLVSLLTERDKHWGEPPRRPKPTVPGVVIAFRPIKRKQCMTAVADD